MPLTRTQISLEGELHRKAKRRAEELGISLAELTRRALAREVEGQPAPSQGLDAIFALGASGGSDIARNKDAYLSEASRNEYRRKTGHEPGS
ncbi:MAG: hypothetical protein WKF62_07220 [Solirubrobacterales bacterium]